MSRHYMNIYRVTLYSILITILQILQQFKKSSKITFDTYSHLCEIYMTSNKGYDDDSS